MHNHFTHSPLTMKFIATFPPNAGQIAGAHTFTTKGQRERFLQRMSKRGIDVSAAVLTPPQIGSKVVAAPAPKA
jgi:hypothetical protein